MQRSNLSQQLSNSSVSNGQDDFENSFKVNRLFMLRRTVVLHAFKSIVKQLIILIQKT